MFCLKVSNKSACPLTVVLCLSRTHLFKSLQITLQCGLHTIPPPPLLQPHFILRYSLLTTHDWILSFAAGIHHLSSTHESQKKYTREVQMPRGKNIHTCPLLAFKAEYISTWMPARGMRDKCHPLPLPHPHLDECAEGVLTHHLGQCGWEGVLNLHKVSPTSTHPLQL